MAAPLDPLNLADVRAINASDLPTRLRSTTWSPFANKLGGGLIDINKEASMQLHLGFIIQQLLPLTTFRKCEELNLQMETGVTVAASPRDIDILLSGVSDSQQYRIAMELKCYKTLASSGGKRGATDIFMKDVYEDLAKLESYVEEGTPTKE